MPPAAALADVGKTPAVTKVYLIDDLDEKIRRLSAGHPRSRPRNRHPADAIVKEGAGTVGGQPASRRMTRSRPATTPSAQAPDQERHLTMKWTRLHGQALPTRQATRLHMHVAAGEENRKNIFTADDPLQSATLRHAIGGVQETVPASMALPLPNVNSYRRFGAQFYVPTRRVGVDNRTVAVRVPNGGSGRRAYRAPCRRRRCQPVPDDVGHPRRHLRHGLTTR